MRPLALLLCLWAGAANADWQIWSLEDASQILDCAVVIEMFEEPDGEALPTDFAAAAEALRASVAMYHGDTFVRQVSRERRDYWSRKPSFGSHHSTGLMPPICGTCCPNVRNG
ncbi:hypothetical protein KZZ07_15150 [Mameliella sp. CS4]|uniref:hypothetical protein n=1 Tax=Mameliella sp. CS4 TaxID=2862329 RepID=UPI001C5F2845|nr:hypothetical protein [Mameliella sp. CS4]MBW4983880.1 hypothetical protein [Mameliella sp. CS4]